MLGQLSGLPLRYNGGTPQYVTIFLSCPQWNAKTFYLIIHSKPVYLFLVYIQSFIHKRSQGVKWVQVHPQARADKFLEFNLEG